MAMSPEATKALILDSIQTVLRSWWTVVAGCAIGLAAAIIALNYVPRIYEARCLIFVSPQKLPKDFIQLTSNDDMGVRLNALESSVLSRPYLSALIDELDRVAPEYEKPSTEEGMERAIKALQRRVRVIVRRSARTFYLTYQDEDPLVAATVVNTLAQRFIDANVSSSKQGATNTKEMMKSFADTTREELRLREEAISKFRAAHVLALSNSLPGNLKQLEQKEKEWDANQRAIERIHDQIAQLKSQRDRSPTDIPSTLPAGTPMDGPTARLQQLQAELDALRLKYSDKHPDYQKKKFEIDEFMKNYVSASGGTVDESGVAVDPGLSPIDAQIAVLQRDLARLNESQVRLDGEKAVLNGRIAQTPKNELALAELSRGIDILKRRFEGTETLAEAAKGAEMAIEAQQGEVFQIVEEAKVPRVPVQPKPMMIYGVGVVIGLVLFVGPGIVRKLLTPVISSENSMKEYVKSPFLFSIPRIPTTEGMRTEYWRRVKNLAFSGLSLAILAFAVLFSFTDKLNF